MRIPSLKEIRGFCAESARQLLETPLYDLGIRAYCGAVGLATLWNPKAAKMKRGHREIWNTLREKINPEEYYIWVHAASLGEFEQGRPLIEHIKRVHPDKKILLTFFSPSGYEVRKNYAGADCVVYLPFDTLHNARKFLRMVKVEKAFFVKYEIWRNYLKVLAEKNIPTYLISAIFRPEQPFFKKRSAWYRYWLHYFTHIFVQTDESRRLLEGVGFNNVTTAGDTRFDRVTDIMRGGKRIPEVEEFFSDAGFRWVFGSSWPEDEAVYFEWLLSKEGMVKGVIAPHEFDDHRLEEMKKGLKGRAVTLSEVRNNPEAAKGKQVLIIDCFGLLSSIYAYADAAHVGGGFATGLHNVNEAAVYGIPVVYGPKYENFVEAVELATLGGGLSVKGKAGWEMVADRLLYDAEERKKRGRWAKEYIESKIGATDKILSFLKMA